MLPITPNYKPYYINFSLLILSIGFLFKISAAPFHFWSPDVYDAIPTRITVFVAVFAKISILIFILDEACIFVQLIFWSTLEIKINRIILIIEILVIYSYLISLFNITQLINILRFYEIFKINKFSNYGLNLIISLQSSLASRRRFYSTSSSLIILNKNAQLDPLWVSGFVDGEGCFAISVTRDPRYKTGWQVRVSFSITLHKKDRPLLEDIKQQSQGLGKITKQGDESIQLQVQSMNEIAKLIEHFDKYQLKTKKLADYLQWKEAFKIIKNQEHLTEYGLKKIVSIKASINLGLSEKLKLAKAPPSGRGVLVNFNKIIFIKKKIILLKLAFPDVVAVAKPNIKDQTIKDSPWIAGFISGEGTFLVSVYKSKTLLGVAVKLVFEVTQHNKDEKLMRSFVIFFKCGRVYPNRDAFYYRVSKFDDIIEKIIPFFKNYPIKGMKALDFRDFCRVAEMMKAKQHLTEEGLEKIKKILTVMKQRRKMR